MIRCARCWATRRQVQVWQFSLSQGKDTVCCLSRYLPLPKIGE